VGRVAEIMSISYAERRRALPLNVGAHEVTIATCEPFDTAWVAEIEGHTRKAIKLLLVSPLELQKYTTEFYTLSRSVRAAIKSGETAAVASFELGNGYYNMSYWGNGRAIYETRHDNLDGAPATVSMDAAEKYYVQSSDLTANRELKAKALFMAAKAEQNRYYLTRKKDSDPQPYSYFRRLRASFSDAQYYQDIIRECGHFRRFLQQ